MEIRFAISPKESQSFNTEELRDAFLVQELMTDDNVKLVYSHYDRMIVGGAKPVNKVLSLPNHPELRADYFLERREIGIINVGGDGTVTVDGKEYTLRAKDCVYLGKGTKDVSFKSADKNKPALFYLLS